MNKEKIKNIIIYKDHTINIQRILNDKTKAIYLIIKKPGTILVSFTKELSIITRQTLRRFVT